MVEDHSDSGRPLSSTALESARLSWMDRNMSWSVQFVVSHVLYVVFRKGVFFEGRDESKETTAYSKTRDTSIFSSIRTRLGGVPRTFLAFS